MPATADAVTSSDYLSRTLGVSEEAIALCRESEFVDLHLDTYIAVRLFGYDLNRWHFQDRAADVPAPWQGRFFGHLDFPRIIESGLSGAMWSITTNPVRPIPTRRRVLLENIDRLRGLFAQSGGRFEAVTTESEYRAARERRAHAALIVIQGGNCLTEDDGYAEALPDGIVTAVTPLHLTHSFLGKSSTPIPSLRSHKGLTAKGRDLIRSLNEQKIFVDLAHISRRGFWDVVDIHDGSAPLIDTHTGVCGVTPHWRNLDDDQIRAIADTGGVVAIIFSPNFLTRPGGPTDAEMVFEHIDYVVELVGEDHAAIGTDYDGAIVPPEDLRDGLALPRLVDVMLRRGYSPARIEKILGENFLRAFAQLRP